VTIMTNLSGRRADPPTVDHPTNPANTAVAADGESADGLAMGTPAQRLGLTVQHLALGVCVVAVDGELNMLTAPLLEACVCEQFAAVPTHLILDLESVRLVDSSGLDCLLRARELAQQTTRTRLHLAGLVSRVVARSLKVTGLLERFDTYPCLTDALAALTDSTKVTISTEQVDLLSVTGRLDNTGLAQLHRQLQALLDTTTQYLVVNLAGVTGCDYRLFEVLARTHQILTDRQGWMRLVGVGSAVRNALDKATLPEFQLVCQASDWTWGLVRP
jgi:anti-sigma B factor antagonist